MSMKDVCSFPNIIVCVNVINSKEIVCLIIMKYITIYLKSKPSSNREILIEKNTYINSKNEEIQLVVLIRCYLYKQ